MTAASTARSNAAQPSVSALSWMFFAMEKDLLIKALEAPYTKFWQALGAFVSAFSDTEFELVETVRILANIPPQTSGAIFTGLRVDAAKDTINRLFDAAGDTTKKERFAPYLAQLSTINTIRNNLLHWGARLAADEGTFLVSNQKFSPSETRLKSFGITPDDLDAMREDLWKIKLFLRIEGPVGDQMPQMHLDEIRRYVAIPWRYKPQTPTPPSTQTPHKPPKQKPPLDASRA